MNVKRKVLNNETWEIVSTHISNKLKAEEEANKIRKEKIKGIQIWNVKIIRIIPSKKETFKHYWEILKKENIFFSNLNKNGVSLKSLNPLKKKEGSKSEEEEKGEKSKGKKKKKKKTEIEIYTNPITGELWMKDPITKTERKLTPSEEKAYNRQQELLLLQLKTAKQKQIEEEKQKTEKKKQKTLKLQLKEQRMRRQKSLKEAIKEEEGKILEIE